MKDLVEDFIANIPEDVKRKIREKYIDYVIRDYRGNAKIYSMMADRLGLMLELGVIAEDQLRDVFDMEEEE